ncbi:MAG TPA: hypothetical protein VGM30_19550 [Puia sp.]|jgi:hypothetical protein
MKMSGHSTQLFIEELLTCFPADSLASRSVSRENEKERRMIATCGRRCVESLMKFDRVGWLAKTFSACLIGGGEWSSSRCRLTWKLQGTKYGRIFCRLRVSGRRIDGKGFGLLPTPVAMDAEGIRQLRRSTIEGMKKGWKASMTLTHYGVAGFLPTPTVRDGKSGLRVDSEAFLKRQEHSRGVPLHEELQRRIGMDFQLSPRFVLEMMGFPPDWTVLPFVPGATNPLGERAMP